MQQPLLRSIALILVLVSGSPTTKASGPQPPPSDACVCDSAKNKGGWCHVCKIGHVAGVRISSYDFFEALDAHGHDFNPASIKCESCRKVLDAGGYCEKCRMGFVGTLAYLSPLTYYIAQGTYRGTDALSCTTCKTNADRGGWCDSCKVGMIGNVAVQDKAEFDRALVAYRIFRDAVNMLEQCEFCAIAMIADGKCPTHKLTYREGRPVVTSKG